MVVYFGIRRSVVVAGRLVFGIRDIFVMGWKAVTGQTKRTYPEFPRISIWLLRS